MTAAGMQPYLWQDGQNGCGFGGLDAVLCGLGMQCTGKVWLLLVAVQYSRGVVVTAPKHCLSAAARVLTKEHDQDHEPGLLKGVYHPIPPSRWDLIHCSTQGGCMCEPPWVVLQV